MENVIVSFPLFISIEKLVMTGAVVSVVRELACKAELDDIDDIVLPAMSFARLVVILAHEVPSVVHKGAASIIELASVCEMEKTSCKPFTELVVVLVGETEMAADDDVDCKVMLASNTVETRIGSSKFSVSNF